MHNRLGHRFQRRIDVPVWLEPKEEEEMPTIVRKSANETVNNSNVLQDDDELLFVVGPNQTWVVDFYLQYTSGAVPDFLVAVNAPSGVVDHMYTAFDAGIVVAVAGDIADGVGAVAGGAAPVVLGYLGHASIAVGAAGGNVNIQWAQNVANASDTIVLLGSYLIANRIA